MSVTKLDYKVRVLDRGAFAFPSEVMIVHKIIMFLVNKSKPDY